MNKTSDHILRLLKAVADVLLPRRCIVCGKKLLLEEEHLCLYCHADIPLTYFWNRDHNPMADRFNEGIQRELEKSWKQVESSLSRNERYAYACALFYYDNQEAYRHIPHQIKYQGNIPAGRYFGLLLGKYIAGSCHLNTVDLVVPVPLHWRRKWKRGYNQAEMIAQGVVQGLGARLCSNLLRRSRFTQSQTRLDIDQKNSNVKDAFTIVPNALYESGIYNCPRHILIVDDIFTTGATVLACYNALRSHFASDVRISVATLGYVGY